MKFQQLALAVSITGLLWSGIQPEATASIPCKSGSTNHSNGSLATCLLSGNMSVSVNGSSIPCKAEEYASFDQNAQFTRCKLSEETKLKDQDGKVSKCPANSGISVEVGKNGPIIRCGG